ncbi:MAG: saccharopine dehydrogenase NADP-binding domain-containing protein [Burkholderiales bacterium]
MLVLGGYGNFGARICRGLSGDPSIQLLIGGRDVQRARAAAGALGHGAEGVAIDQHAPDTHQTLQRLGVDLVVHTAGPFQQQDYRLAMAAATARAHYIDIADGRRFVCDFPPTMDAAFRAADRTALTGASTVPALSSAVVDRLCDRWQRINSIDICIAPAQTAPRGVATLAAVLSYCGEPIQVWDGGRWRSQRGWARPEPVRFARLRSRLGALCDIPDLELFPAHYRTTQRVMFHAALEVGIAQRGLAILAALRAIGLIKRPQRLAWVLNQAARAVDFLGSALGGMVVRVVGVDQSGNAMRRTWNITAPDDHGPEIPCMAAILLTRRLARAPQRPVGAYTCVGMLSLAEFEPEFARWGMTTDIANEGSDDGAASI